MGMFVTTNSIPLIDTGLVRFSCFFLNQFWYLCASRNSSLSSNPKISKLLCKRSDSVLGSVGHMILDAATQPCC